MHTQTIYIDMTPGSINPVVHVSQYDTGAVTLEFILVENGATVALSSGNIALLNGSKPDRTAFSYSGTINGMSILFPCTEQMTNVAGDVLCELSLSNSEGILGTANFTMNVEASPLQRARISQNEIATLSALLAAAQSAASDAEAAAAALDSFSAVTRVDTASANLNHYVSRNGFFYFPYSVVTNPDSRSFPHPKIWDPTITDGQGNPVGGWVDSDTVYPGWLHVMYCAGYTKQLYYAHGELNRTDYYLWERTYDGTSWSDWSRLLTNREVSNSLANSIYTIPTMSLVYQADQKAGQKAPILHNSAESTYGLGNLSKYGHVKLVRALNQTEYQEGCALSAEQGNVLINRIVGIENVLPKNDNNALIKNHRDQNGSYGLGSANYYGHTKVIENLTTDTANQPGVALGAYQGYLLKGYIDNNASDISALRSRVGILDGTNTLSEGDNLNNLSYGIYFTNSAEVAGSLANRPDGIQGSFTLYCDKYGYTGTLQRLYYPSDGSFYYRIRTSNGSSVNFNKWRRVAGIIVEVASNS